MSDTLDIFEQRLQTTTDALVQCQRGKGFVKTYQSNEYLSCNDCPELIGCKIRKEYVDAVYNSMSKGATGGFEF